MSYIFISYSKLNKDYAYSLADFLLEQGFDVWIDRSGIEYGVDWWDAIVDGLRGCGVFIVVMSEQAKASQWVKKETLLAGEWKKPTFPILYNGERWELYVDTQFINCSDASMPDDEFIKQLSQHIIPTNDTGHEQSDLKPETVHIPPTSPSLGFDVWQVIDLFWAEYEAGQWADALNLLGRIRASKQDTSPFDPDDFDPEIQQSIEAEIHEREQIAYQAERARKYQQITKARTLAIQWKMFQRFRQDHPDYDPDDLANSPEFSPFRRAERLKASSAESIRQIIGDPFDWCDVPAGDFLYGDDDFEYAAPRQTLALPDYSIAKYPITYRQYQAFIDAEDGFNDPRWWNGLAESYELYEQKWKIDDHPRENVNWYQSIAFCRWLSHRLGGGYALDRLDEWSVRLPTEFEWEKAARGTKGLLYPWGNEFDTSKCNSDVEGSGIGKTTPVIQYPQGASPYGALDMAGNVWEWCLTEYDNPQMDLRQNLGSTSIRGLRGGSWLGNLTDRFLCGYRGRYIPHDGDDLRGFRVSRFK